MARSDININPDVLENQIDNYSSLSDLNHIPVFTNDYGETIAKKNNKQKEQEKRLQTEIFQKEMILNQITDDITGQLFLEEKQQVIKQDVLTDGTVQRYIGIGMGVVILLFLMFMGSYIRKRQQRMKEKGERI